MSGESADRARLQQATRQSPIAVAFIAWRLLRRVGLINLGVAVGFALSGRLSVVIGALAITAAIVLTAATAVSWWRFTFCVVGEELLVTKGVLSIERLVIPLDRVQSVAIDQTLFHRLVGLVKASVDTAGTEAAEFTIDAVSRSDAEALRRLAAGEARVAEAIAGSGVASAAGQPAVEETLIRRTPGELIRVGVTSVPWAGLVVLFPLFAFAGEIGDLFGIDLQVRSTIRDRVDGVTPTRAVLGGAIVLVIATLVGVLLQVVRTILIDWDMTIVRTPNGIRRTSGLFSTRSTASTIRRVQSFDTQQSPVQRWAGIRQVRLETVGAGDLVVPGTTDAELDRLHHAVFGHVISGHVTFGSVTMMPLDRRVSRWWVFLRVRSAALIAAAVTAAAWFVIGAWAAVIPLSLIVSWAVAERAWRNRRWGYDGERLAERQRVVSETTREIEAVTAQGVTLNRSYFERRRGLATVVVHTASSSMTIPLIDVEDARALRDELLAVVESSTQPAM